jgi:predicted nucleic acid-binding protein
MKYVLDTSGAFQILFQKEKAKRYTELLKDADAVISSSLYKAECANVLWKYVRAGFLSEQQAAQTIDRLFDLVDIFIDPEENAQEAFHEAVRLDHSVYDMLYFTLARRNNAVLLTSDKRLKSLALEEGVQAE